MPELLDLNSFQKVREALSGMKNPVKLVVFTSPSHESGASMAQLASELSAANPLISSEIRVFDSEKDAALEYKVSSPSTMCIVGKEKRSMKVLGLPSGLEFHPFLRTLVDASNNEPDIQRDIQEKIKAINFDVNLKVFVTPVCPHCPGVARLAHLMALLNPRVSSEVIDAQEFPELSMRYQVSGVPKMVINDLTDVVGGYPPEVIIKRILESKH